MPNYSYNVYEVYADGTEFAHALNIQGTNYKFDNLDDGQSYTYRIDLLKDGEKVAEEVQSVTTKGIPNKVFHLYEVFTTEDAGLFYINHSQMLEGYAEIYLLNDLNATAPDPNVDRLVYANLTLEHEYNAAGGDKDDDGTLLYETRFIVDGLSSDTDYRMAARTVKTNSNEDVASNEWALLDFKTKSGSELDDSGNAPDPAKDHTIIVIDCGKVTGAKSVTINDMPIYSDDTHALDLDGNKMTPLSDVFFYKHPKTGDPNDWKTGYQTIEFDGYFDNSVTVTWNNSGGGVGGGSNPKRYTGGGPNYGGSTGTNSNNHNRVCFIGRFKGNMVPDLPLDEAMFFEVQYRASRENPITAIENLDVSNITTMKGWFFGKYYTDSYSVHHLDKWNVSNVTNFSNFGYMYNKFSDHLPTPYNQIGNLKHWDVRNATNVDYMFGNGAKVTPCETGMDEWCFNSNPSRKDYFGNFGSNACVTPKQWSGGGCPEPPPHPDA